MQVMLDATSEALIREKVDVGLYDSEADVVHEALRLLEERDRELAWLRAEVAHAGAQVARAETVEFNSELIDRLSRGAEENSQRRKPINDAVRP